METKQLLQAVEDINIWKKGSQRAPHKPLLILLALGMVANGENRMQPFTRISSLLKDLLIQFGPHRQNYHPEYPFWRLQNDNLWEVSYQGELLIRQGNQDPLVSSLINAGAMGGFPEDIYHTLRHNPGVIQDIAIAILEGHFTESYYEDLLSAVNLTGRFDLVVRRRRDPQFRLSVLQAYRYKCAVCEADVRLDNTLLALEAAHIKWHQAHGPDSVNNGLALCTLHHKLFDRGAFTVMPDRRTISIADGVNGGPAVHHWLTQFKGNRIGQPARPEFQPEEEFLSWHAREVFRQSDGGKLMGRVADKG